MPATVHAHLPPSFRKIRLELAREPRRPEGDAHTGYTLVAPLNKEGQLDAELARTFRDACTVVRFQHDDSLEHGKLIRRPGGSWAFHYDATDGLEDDDPAYRLGDHFFLVGEYVTINEEEGQHTYKVVFVEPL